MPGTCLIAILIGSPLPWYLEKIHPEALQPGVLYPCMLQLEYVVQRVPMKSSQPLAVNHHSLPKPGLLTGSVVSEDLFLRL